MSTYKAKAKTKLSYIALAWTLTGCLDARVDDTPEFSQHILPAGAAVPDVTTNASLLGRISANDGLNDQKLTANGNVVARQSGYANGEQVEYWDFGPASSSLATAYILADGIGNLFVGGHFLLLDSVPGDPGYSPFRSISIVNVTDKYNGELITSVQALADAIELGLVEDPVKQDRWANYPVVPPTVNVEVQFPNGIVGPVGVYAEGHVVYALLVGGVPTLDNLRFLEETGVRQGRVHIIRDSSEAFVDVADSAVFGGAAASPVDGSSYSPLVSFSTVVVNDADVLADRDAESDLFDVNGSTLQGPTANVVDFEFSEDVFNWQIQLAEGSL